jgi:hypothetical protein
MPEFAVVHKRLQKLMFQTVRMWEQSRLLDSRKDKVVLRVQRRPVHGLNARVLTASPTCLHTKFKRKQKLTRPERWSCCARRIAGVPSSVLLILVILVIQEIVRGLALRAPRAMSCARRVSQVAPERSTSTDSTKGLCRSLPQPRLKKTRVHRCFYMIVFGCSNASPRFCKRTK